MAKKTTVGEDRVVKVYDAEGATTAATVTLPASIFDVPLNVPLIHQVVEAQRAAARQGSASTKTRGDVSGGGKKPWRQKGTGRARQGSTRAPQWKGGGVVHGPHPRSYSQRTPKKMIAGALRSALSDRARNDAIYVFSALVSGEKPSTKAAIATLSHVTRAKKILVVVDRDSETARVTVLSYKNVPGVHVVWSDQLNTYDVVDADRVIFTEEALNAYIERVQAARRRGDAAETEKVESKVKGVEQKKSDKTSESYEADHSEELAKTAKAEAKEAKKAKKAKKAKEDDK